MSIKSKLDLLPSPMEMVILAVAAVLALIVVVLIMVGEITTEWWKK